MPPRLPLAQVARCLSRPVEVPLRPASLVSLFARLSVQQTTPRIPNQTQTRSAHILASLSDNKGAYHKRIRKGRGPSSGYGKTSGRGQKGTKARSKVNRYFQGGQTPLIVSHGVKGFVNHRAPIMSKLNLDKLQQWIDAGRIDATKPLTPRELIKSGVMGGSIKDGIKLLARGKETFKHPIDISVSRASATAIEAIEAAGGKIVTRFYTREALKRLVKGESTHTDAPLPIGAEHVDAVLQKTRTASKHFYRLPDPTSRWEIEYYRDPAHRGYLSHMLKPGESPSLYFKVPAEKPIKWWVVGYVYVLLAALSQLARYLRPVRLSTLAMSLFGSSPPGESSAIAASSSFANNNSQSSLFEDEPPMTKSTTSALFADDDSGASSPWDMPTPRKQPSRADLIRSLLPPSDVPDSYIGVFDTVVRDDGSGGRVTSGGVARTLAAGKLSADQQARVMGILSPLGSDGDISLGRSEFNVLLALIGLAQEGETISLDSVDERRRKLPQPKFAGLVESAPPATVLPQFGELAAKPPQRPVTPPKLHESSPSKSQRGVTLRKPSMEYPEDPWNTPDVHKTHNHGPEPPRPIVNDVPSPVANVNGNRLYGTSPEAPIPGRTTSTFTTSTVASGAGSVHQSTASVAEPAWNFVDGNPSAAGGFNDPANNPTANPFGGNPGGREPGGGQPSVPNPSRTIGSGRTGGTVEETILVTLLPEKEGMFMFQHHNYEVTSSRRGSKVIRRYSDFVWLLDCLHKRYPFRVLPLLPPKRVAVNGNHLSNDGAFIEKRRRGLARFLNFLVRHPVLGQEQLVIMFLTVPTELSVWRKQATISVQDEFAGRSLPIGLEDSLPPTLEELFARTRAGVRRSADLYISICNIMDRLVKRSEGVAADHARIALSLNSLTEVSADTYATDTNDVPLLNDGLQAMSKHLRTSQSLMEDESRAWDEGVLEDLKRQRDALVSLRDLFDRRERLDKDNIPHLERRIATNENKLSTLRAKPDGMVKPGEIEKVVEAIIKDKESIVNQHNRSVFVKECLRDELLFFQHTQYNVSRWNQDWAQERVKYSEMLADNWRRLLDDLEGMPLGD
ncbi:hypothetical protein B0H66DRAFT_577398 [Apodospora peruviana]|uniref:Sorting nexin MVP1 n=1 Tax=Apodospora peruviana TaxID=516989 RepID=A0AAE0LZ54_9PEZI|nr:hypothetical protein B0H66DRAFT_577398 [Apodospora peruviana]